MTKNINSKTNILKNRGSSIIRKVDKDRYITKKINGHEFKILKKGETKKWLKLREYLL